MLYVSLEKQACQVPLERSSLKGKGIVRAHTVPGSLQKLFEGKLVEYRRIEFNIENNCKKKWNEKFITLYLI